MKDSASKGQRMELAFSISSSRTPGNIWKDADMFTITRVRRRLSSLIRSFCRSSYICSWQGTSRSWHANYHTWA